nr:immunoglobulin heavy chain junction region [Macaca mulatta]
CARYSAGTVIFDLW